MYLLNQVRACTEGMTVGCWVGSTLVRFAVGASLSSLSLSSPSTRRRK